MVALLPAAAVSYVGIFNQTNAPLQSLFMTAAGVAIGYGTTRIIRNQVLRFTFKDHESYCLNTKPTTEEKLEAKQRKRAEAHQNIFTKEKKHFYSHVVLQMSLGKMGIIGLAIAAPNDTLTATAIASLFSYYATTMVDTLSFLPQFFNLWTIEGAPPAPAEEPHPSLKEKFLNLSLIHI